MENVWEVSQGIKELFGAKKIILLGNCYFALRVDGRLAEKIKMEGKFRLSSFEIKTVALSGTIAKLKRRINKATVHGKVHE